MLKLYNLSCLKVGERKNDRKIENVKFDNSKVFCWNKDVNNKALLIFG